MIKKTVDEIIIEALGRTDPKALSEAMARSMVTCPECGAGLLVKPDGTLPPHNIPGNPYWGCDNRNPFAKGKM